MNRFKGNLNCNGRQALYLASSSNVIGLSSAISACEESQAFHCLPALLVEVASQGQPGERGWGKRCAAV